MLKSLFIKNIVLIDKMRLNFYNGLTIFSGETGAGKSIILTSLGLASGMRADFSLIRNNSSEGMVVAEFDIEKNQQVKEILLEKGLESNSTVILRRILNRDGISKAFVNDSPVTAGFLQEIGSSLVEIHGQNEKIGLLDPVNHIKILDKYGLCEIELSKVENSYASFKKLKEIYSELSNIEKNRSSKIKEIKNDLKIIENINLEKNEYEQLLKRRNAMMQFEKIFHAINNIYNIFDDEGDSLLTTISKNTNILEQVSIKNSTTDEIDELIKSLNNLIIEGKDILLNIAKIKDEFVFDQKELDSIEQRLFDISSLARKFNIQPNELIDKYNLLSEELSAFDNNAQNIEQIKEKLILAEKKYQFDCSKLSEKRKGAALKIEELINQEMKPLKLENASFKVKINEKEKVKCNANGSDTVKFIVQLNKGSLEGEIHKISSGGELSRLMLAINLVIAKNINSKTLIFDEVDSGVSGAVADSIGVRLLNLSKFQQVLLVTHLPQVAARGNKHYKTSKFVDKGITYTGIKELTIEDRVEEIAKMISGNTVTQEALMLSNKLLKN